MNTSGPTCLRSTGLVDDYMVKRSPFVTAQEVKNSFEYAVHETYPKKRNWVGEEQSNEKPLKIHQKWWQVDSVEKYRTAYDPKETFSSANNGGAAVMTWTLSRIVTLAFSEHCSAESRNRRMHRRRQCVQISQNASQLTGQDFII